MSTPRQLAKVKHKPVPAALHAELSEYSSLLRAIRASDTLDVTSQLTRYYVGKGKEKAVQQIRNAAPSSPVMGEARPGKGEAGKERSKRPSSHETWTRWPLLAEDVPVPEWTLEDEVAQLTTFLLCSEPISTSEIDSNCDSDLDMNSSPELISSLTFASTHILDGILASLATIIPKRPPSMSNRLAPVGWQTVLAAAQVQAAGQRGGGLSGLSPSIKYVPSHVLRRRHFLFLWYLQLKFTGSSNA
ncbi:hypothetical protein GYMLUDRAFT_154314 [Collybiopsis luxurians FD-317 M1]|nr:hypothetical protein GYMLUDRAFT_154314 [Collybiopsis luxurians FD-317 M1]